MTEKEVYHQRLLQIKTELGNIAMPIAAIMMQKEIEQLPNFLERDEKIIHAVTGNWDGRKHGLLTATDRRLLFLSYTVFGSFQETVRYEEIESLTVKQGILYGDITIITGKTILIKNVNNNKNALSFSNTLNDYLSRKSSFPLQQSHKQDTDTIYKVLENLGSLREKGILTDSEFQEQKKKLLDRL